MDRDDIRAATAYSAAIAAAYPHIYMIEIARRVASFEEATLVASLQKRWRADFSLKDFATLTDLPNRYLFMDRFEQALKQWERDGNLFALLVIDLDHFKKINASHGNDVGDQVLIAVGKRIQLQLRASDTMARYGGDEFAALLKNILPFDEARGMAEKVRLAFIDPVETSAGLVKVTCSIGVAMCPTHGDTQEALMQAADKAACRAKDGGGNAISVADATAS